MAIRAEPENVQARLGANWDGVTDLAPYMRSASIFVDNVVACAANKGLALSAEVLLEIEEWMGGYFYTKMDPLYVARSTASASGTFMQGNENPYLEAARMVDPSGCVAALAKRQVAGGFWAGKMERDRLSYDQRN